MSFDAFFLRRSSLSNLHDYILFFNWSIKLLCAV